MGETPEKSSRRKYNGKKAGIAPAPFVIPGCAFFGAGPESILTMVVMDSGLALMRARE
jgi:hypothetical protein